MTQQKDTQSPLTGLATNISLSAMQQLFSGILKPSDVQLSDEQLATMLRKWFEISPLRLKDPESALDDMLGDGLYYDVQLLIMQRVAQMSDVLRRLPETQRQPLLSQIQKRAPLFYAALRYNDDRVTGAAQIRWREFMTVLGKLPDDKPLNDAIAGVDARYATEVSQVAALNSTVHGRRIRGVSTDESATDVPPS